MGHSVHHIVVAFGTSTFRTMAIIMRSPEFFVRQLRRLVVLAVRVVVTARCGMIRALRMIKMPRLFRQMCIMGMSVVFTILLVLRIRYVVAVVVLVHVQIGFIDVRR